MGRILVMIVCAVGLAVAPARAEDGDADRLFRAGVLAEAAPGTVLRFVRERDVPEVAAERLPPIEDGALVVSVVGKGYARRLEVRFDEPGREVTLPAMPSAAAHPAMLVFLETTVASLALLSGGSPFYIKNRFIEALQAPAAPETVTAPFDGRPRDAQRWTLAPLDGDPAGQPGRSLAGLRLTFTLSDAVPGGLLSAVAEVGEYRHALTLEDVETTP